MSEFEEFAGKGSAESESPTKASDVVGLKRTIEGVTGRPVKLPKSVDDQSVYVQMEPGKEIRIPTKAGNLVPLEPTVATELTSMEGHFAELRDVYQSSFDNPHIDIDTKRVFSNKLRNLAEKIIPKQRGKKR